MIKIKRIFNKKIILLLIGLVFVSGLVFAAENSRRIRKGDPYDRNKVNLRLGAQQKSWVNSLANSDDKCRRIALASSATNDVFVPYKTQAE
jgi:hypothetical protein